MSRIIPTVGVLIFQDNKVLLVRHGASAGHITNVHGLPAGRIKKGEAEITTAQRELKEETGLIAAANDLIEYPDNNYVGKIKRKNDEVNIYPYKIFICLNFSGKLRATAETTPLWVKTSQAKRLNLLPNVGKIINDGLKFLKSREKNAKLDKKTEQKIKQEATKKLKLGKPGWDIPHTLAGVWWIKELMKSEGGDERTLIPAIYLHDIGYPKLKKGYDYNAMMASRKIHAQLSEKYAGEILEKLHFPANEIKRIKYLVRHHDEHDYITDPERQLVFEADGLAQIDVKKVRPNFDKKNCQVWFNKYFKKRLKRVKTKTGKMYYNVLVKKFLDYIKHLD